jgi:hypothetical protein
MCRLNQGARDSPTAQSLALVRPRTIKHLRIEKHPGWSDAEKRKLEKYANQPGLFDRDGHVRTPLEAPRFRAAYEYHCFESGCRGHRQGVLDWELVALQRHMRDLDDRSAEREIRARFLEQMCSESRAPAFFVGNQAKRPQTFSVLGIFYPKR